MSDTSRIGIGSVQFGSHYGISNDSGKTPETEVANILNVCREYGIGLIDTAAAYGDAEATLGQIGVGDFRVISKFMPDAPIKEQFHTSLGLLGVDALYGYMAHRPMSLLDDSSAWRELAELKERGLVSKIGYSLNEPNELQLLLGKGYVPDIVQVPFNYFDRRFLPSFDQLIGLSCEIHVRSVFLQGLFFSDVRKLPKHFDEVKYNLADLQRIGQLPSSLLNFVLQHSAVDKVILGFNNGNQLTELLHQINCHAELPSLPTTISDDILIPSRWPKD